MDNPKTNPTDHMKTAMLALAAGLLCIPAGLADPVEVQVPDTGDLPFKVHEPDPACKGNPCASVTCTATDAFATANGSEESWANAYAGDEGHGHAKPGPSAAHAGGGIGYSSADARGKKNYSLKEANADCSFDSSTASAGGQALPLDQASLSCVLGDAVAVAGRFLGQLYVDAAGAYVAFDEARQEALLFDGPAFAFDGSSLTRTAAVDLSALAPVQAMVGVTLVDGGEDGTSSCSVTLVA